MTYTQPTVTDLGDLAEITKGLGSIGSEDGAGKTIQAEVQPVVELSIGVL